MPPEMLAAMQIATRKKDERSFYVGAALRRKDGVLVTFSNVPCTASVPSHHAEARCVRKATPDSVVYVARLRKDGQISMAKPCHFCQKRLRTAGVKKVYYTNWEGEIEQMTLQ